jgi:hypothetical protein
VHPSGPPGTSRRGVGDGAIKDVAMIDLSLGRGLEESASSASASDSSALLMEPSTNPTPESGRVVDQACSSN